MALTPKQAAFVREYLVDLNATKAAERVGYSIKTAESQGSRLLSNVKIAKEVAEVMRRRSERVEIKADDVLRELLLLARTDIGQAFDEEGHLKKIHEIPEDVRRAICGLETEELPAGLGRIRKLKFWDKTKALEMLGRHLQLFTDKIEHSGSVNITIDLGAG